eukprot:5475029-Lingulodinium_polyedra.AAC.1
MAAPRARFIAAMNSGNGSGVYICRISDMFGHAVCCHDWASARGHAIVESIENTVPRGKLSFPS